MRRFSLHEIYTEIREDVKLIPEVGEGTSEPFKYKGKNESFFGGGSFTYIISGEVRNDDEVRKVPIRLQGISYKERISDDMEYDRPEFFKFLNEPQGTVLKGYEIIFSQEIGDGVSFAQVNDRVFMFRLMATIKEILQKEFNKSKPDLLIYTPNKKGSEAVEKTGRHKLYSAFINKAFPSARVFVDDRSEEITYKLK